MPSCSTSASRRLARSGNSRSSRNRSRNSSRVRSDRDIPRRAGNRIAGAANALMLDLGEPPFGKIGQFQIVEEQVEKFLAGQHEAERVFAVAAAAILRTTTAAAARA